MNNHITKGITKEELNANGYRKPRLPGGQPKDCR